MPIDPALYATLTIVGHTMVEANDPWWIIASAAVALHGAVADVDVLLSVDDARRILPSLGIAPRPGVQHARFRSQVFGTWTAPPLPVEFMAGFHHRLAGQWQRVTPQTREAIEIGAVCVFIPSRTDLGDILRRFGRTKDIMRAARLAALP